MKKLSKCSISVYNNQELEKVKNHLIEEYPEDKFYIEHFLVDMTYPMCVHVYKNVDDGFGNRIEYDLLDNLEKNDLDTFNKVIPLEVYKNPKDYPEYFL